MKTALLLLTAACASAQTIEIKSLFQPAPLSGVWKHHAGDDPRWADPAFDDSAWANVRMPEGAAAPGDGFSWYRFRIQLPENMPTEPLALMVGGFGNGQAYQVFWNGQNTGAVGDPDGGASRLLISAPGVIPVPGHERDAVVAIRVQTGNGLFSVNISRAFWIGTVEAIQARAGTVHGDRLRQTQPQLLVAASLVLSGSLFLLLPLWRKDAPEYFWFGLWLLCGTTLRVVRAIPDAVGLERSLPASWLFTISSIGLVPAWLGWMRILFRGRITPSVWFVCTANVVVNLSIAVFLTEGGSLPRNVQFASNMVGIGQILFTYSQVGWRSFRTLDRMLAIHVVIMAYLLTIFITIVPALFWPNLAIVVQGPLAINSTALLFTFAMTILMNQRSARLLAEQQRLSREMESAAEVQSLLLTSLPDVGDAWQIDPVYVPASEVGGDFYRIFPADEGAILAVVGDVSGKGLRAAMTVSGLMCAMEAIETREPGPFLTKLNAAASAHIQSGFATCCATLIRPNGEAVIANAGHPSPYCDGYELETEPGLPLGIVPGVEYSESVARGKRFTFVSDGVVEAANAAGELFGFDRTLGISTQSAQEIAETAKVWGQNDDITVVTVQRVRA